ncbi:CPBP family intramembrane glutamic endopeptidase [Frateuria hangzhouensis]|uniref:CPBP family intramembrane glutamic endopeptidase n=1 Tax=Frateuria hangzhouensis TaxID=2995589 RepID=UPI002260E93E|nr:CPBP family intramembrane glutamic endopeptidase [Frateuria sp. STR12]MCX7513514.1 CPBP family intramembrane metalloprotease [Frateuria sp. STR12]
MADTRKSSGIGLFLLLAFGLSSVFYALVIATGHLGGARGMYVTGLMWCPGIAALLTCRLRGEGPGRLGWRWGAWRWQWVAYLVPLGYAAVAYAIVWSTGLGGFGNTQFEEAIGKALGWGDAPAWLNTTMYFVLLASVGMARSLTTALGEEIGWRGFLAPALVARLGFTGGALVTGAIWAAWHLPILLFADYNAGTPWWFAMPCFVVLVLSSSVVMTWLRLRSGSLWTAAVMHASHNLFIQAFFTPITTARGAITPYAIDEFGFVLPLVMVVVAVAFWLRRGAVTVPQGA